MPDSESQFYFTQDGVEFGPVPAAHLKKLAASGRLRPTDKIKKGEAAKWVEARSVKGLLPAESKTSAPARNAPDFPSQTNESPKQARKPSSPLNRSRRKFQMIAILAVSVTIGAVGLGGLVYWAVQSGRFKPRPKLVEDLDAQAAVEKEGAETLVRLKAKGIQIKKEKEENEVREQQEKEAKEKEDKEAKRREERQTKQREADLAKQEADRLARRSPEQVVRDCKKSGSLLVLDPPFKRSIYINNPINNSELSSIIKILPTVESITLESNSLTDECLACLVDCPELTSLSFRGKQFTSSALAYIRDLKHLREVGSYMDLTGADFSHFATLPHLHQLSLFKTSLTDKDLIQLHSLRGLVLLEFDARLITDEGLRNLKPFTELRSLNLTGSHITDAGLTHLQGKHFLFTLVLDETKITGRGLKTLSEAKNIQAMSLKGTKVRDEDIKFLKQWRLQSLDLSDLPITDQGLAKVTELADLHTLKLNQTQVSDQGLKQLGKLPNLAHFELRGCSLTGQGFQNVSNSKVTRIVLDTSSITDEGLRHLCGFPNLEYLSLRGTKITKAGLKSLKPLVKMKDLELRDTAIKSTDVEDIRSFLRPNETTSGTQRGDVLSIGVDGNRIGGDPPKK